MDIHKIVEATLRVTEDEMIQANDPMASEAPAEGAMADMPEITPEYIQSLTEELPELANYDQAELLKGITVELEHYDTVGGDMVLVAKIALDHINETPEGKSYYDALEAMEHELKESPAEEAAEQEMGTDVEPGEEATETPNESPFESVKECDEPEDDEQSAMKKEANKKEEDRINKEAVKK